MVHKVIIIGSGPAGLTAAIYAARANLAPVLFEGNSPGGPLTLEDYKIENFPGFADGIPGRELIDAIKKQAERFGAKFLSREVTKVDFKSRPFKIFSDSSPHQLGEASRCGDGEKYEAESVIVATGTEPKKLGIKSEARFVGRGISYCATCDGPLFKNKNIIVLGGGNSALHEALILAGIAAEVTLIDVLDFSFASQIMRDRVKANKKIKIIANTEIKEFVGEKKLEKTRLYNNQTKKASEMAVDGVFVSIGRTPNTKIFEGYLKRKDGYIITEHDSTKTDISGIFSAGDVSDRQFRQAVVAAGRGCMAAMEAERYLRNR